MGFINDGRAATDFLSAHDEPRETVGALFTGSNGIYEYVQVNEAVSLGSWLLINPNGESELLDTTNSGSASQKVGVAKAAATEDQYLWAWRGCGSEEALVANGTTAGALTTSGTAGVADTGGDAITGARNIDTGVTGTPVTVFCPILLSTNS
jgi:hypothetical protein